MKVLVYAHNFAPNIGGAETYVMLLAAHARGLAGYWRTPGVLRSQAGLAALGIPPDERFVGLVHLGSPRQDKEPPERTPVTEIVEYLS